jgi:hypothetical protein
MDEDCSCCSCTKIYKHCTHSKSLVAVKVISISLWLFYVFYLLRLRICCFILLAIQSICFHCRSTRVGYYYHNTWLQPHIVITCGGKHIYHCPSTLSMPAPECSSYSTHVLSAIWRPLLSQQANQHTALIHHLSATHTTSIFLPKVWKFGNSKGVSVRITSRRQSTYYNVVLDGAIVWVRRFVNATFLITSDPPWSHQSGS